MKAFKKWYINICKRTYQYFNHNWCYDCANKQRLKGRKEGWKAALEWIKKEVISLDERGDISRGIINRELED